MSNTKIISCGSFFLSSLILSGLLITLVTLTFPAQTFATNTRSLSYELAMSINKSGRQRMLSQRMLKAYCQIILRVRDDEAKVQMDKAVVLFDKQLLWLKTRSPTVAISEQLAKIEKTWGQYKVIVTGTVNREGARKLITLSDQLLAESHRVVVQLQDFAGGSSARLVNMSGRQRMLSQRVAKFYMLKELGFRDEYIGNELIEATREFVKAHNELLESKMNTDKINVTLEKADIQWQLYQYSITKRADVSLALFVSTTSEKILKLMDRVTGMYETVMATRKATGNTQ